MYEGERITNLPEADSIEEGYYLLMESPTLGWRKIAAENFKPPETDLYRWDFTKSLIDEVQGVEAILTNASRDNNGVYLNTNNSCCKFLTEDISTDNKSYTIEIEIGESNAGFSGGYNGRFLMFTYDKGYIYRGATNRWAFYSKNGAWVDASWSDRGQKNIFNNSIIKAILYNGKCEIYKNDNLVQTFTNVVNVLFNSIGSTNGNAFYNITIKSIRIYETEG